jgi:hypothetical protein
MIVKLLPWEDRGAGCGHRAQSTGLRAQGTGLIADDRRQAKKKEKENGGKGEREIK